MGTISYIDGFDEYSAADATLHGWDLKAYELKAQAFGWATKTIDGHDFKQINSALARAGTTKGQPLMIIAKTIKGKGVSFLEDQEGWHGKALSDEDYHKAVAELGPVNLGKTWTIKSAN